MARDGSETRARLLVEAERLFAEVGVWQAATGDIVRAAGQRNASALTYHFGSGKGHFGSRQGVLDAILADHGNPIDAHRGDLLAKIAADAPDVRTLVDALVRPMTEVLDDPRGRRYVRIVNQLSDRFPAWRDAPTGVDQTHLERALTILESLASGDRATLREARLLAMIQLMTVSLAARAGELDHGQPSLDAPTYERHLVDVLVGVLTAPGAEPVDQAGA